MRGAVALFVTALVACAGTPLHERYDQTSGPAAAPSGAPVASSTEAAPPASASSAPAPARMCGPDVGADGGAPTIIAARHVLVQWMGCRRAPDTVVRTRDQAYTVAKEVLRRAKAGEDLGRLATEFSDEPNAGSRSGSLGCFKRGMMDKRFEDAAFALKPGEVSDVVETEFGFHVIQRTE